MTASQLHTLPVAPMYITPNSTGSVVNPNINRNRHTSENRVKRNLFGAPPPGEISRICQEENIKQCNEFEEKYGYNIQKERFTCNNNNNNNNNNSNNNNNEDEITTTTPTTTSTEAATTQPQTTKNNNQIIELIKNNGQDQESNINNLLTTTITTNETEIDSNDDDKSKINVVPNSITKSIINSEIYNTININVHDTKCDFVDIDYKLTKIINNNDDDVNNEVGICNKSLNDNNSNNTRDVMCNQINSTTSTTPSVATKKLIDIPLKNQRFLPYHKTQSQQILLTDMYKCRKSSPVNLTRAQKANIHFDDIDQQQKQQQQLQEQHLTSK